MGRCRSRLSSPRDRKKGLSPTRLPDDKAGGGFLYAVQGIGYNFGAPWVSNWRDQPLRQMALFTRGVSLSGQNGRPFPFMVRVFPHSLRATTVYRSYPDLRQWTRKPYDVGMALFPR